MAIRVPNLGIGNGQTGDNEFKIRSDYNHNFTDHSNAASRLVGGGGDGGTVPLNTDKGINGAGVGGMMGKLSDYNVQGIQSSNLYSGFYFNDNNYLTSEPEVSPHRLPIRSHSYVIQMLLRGTTESDTRSMQVIFPANPESGAGFGDVFYKSSWDGAHSPWYKFYTTGNTTKEAGTGYLVASSPVLKVQHDSFEKVHEAEQLDIDVQHVATGAYEITGTTGLRDNDGWYLKPPKDINGNVLCICEATQDGDVITLNTYKKKFDFETVSIVADYEQPTDIPEGAEVMLRFNDLPAEPMPPEV